MSGKPILIKMRAYNLRLIRAREELGLKQREAAERIGCTQEVLCSYETLRRSPIADSGDELWKGAAMRVAEFYGLSCEYLWPEEVVKIRKRAFQMELSAADISTVMLTDGERNGDANRLREALTQLADRPRRAIEMHAEGATFDEIGAAIGGVSRERARQIHVKAFDQVRSFMKRHAEQ